MHFCHIIYISIFTGFLERSTVAILVENTLLVALLICNELVLSNLCFLLFLQTDFVLSLIVLRPLGQGFYNLDLCRIHFPFPIFSPALCFEFWIWSLEWISILCIFLSLVTIICKYCFHNPYKEIAVVNLSRATFSVVICIENHKFVMLFFADSDVVSPH